MEKTYRPGIILSFINRDRNRNLEITETGGSTEDVILTVEIRNGVLYLTQSAGGYTATVEDGVLVLRGDESGSLTTAVVENILIMK